VCLAVRGIDSKKVIQKKRKKKKKEKKKRSQNNYYEKHIGICISIHIFINFFTFIPKIDGHSRLL